MRKSFLPLVALVVAFTVLVLLYSEATLLFEAPDEVWHYAYVRYVAEGHGLPALTDNRSGANQEVAQPPLYYGVAAVVSGLVADEDLDELMWHNPGFGYQAPGTVNDNKNMLVHTDRESFPWRGAVLAVRLARLVSLAFGLATVLAAWGLGREAFPGRPAGPLVTAAVVAFTPQFLFLSGVVSNDSAAAALSTAALWALARTAQRGITLRRSLIAGLLIGLAILSKTSSLLLAVPALAAVALAPMRAPHHLRRRAGALLALGGMAAVVGGWWYLRNALVYHDPLALHAHVDTLWGRPAPASLGTLLGELPLVYRSFWGAFGWGHVFFPGWVYLALGAGLVAGLVGWARAWVERSLPGRGRVFLLAGLWWMMVFAALVQWMRQVEAPHGRLLFPAIAAKGLLVAGGWLALERKWVQRVLLGCMAVLSLVAPWAVIRPAFAPPRLITPEAAAATVESEELVYGGTARLLGVLPLETSVTAGERLAVRACWEALAPMAEEYTVFVHLVGRNDVRVAERYTYPGLGRFPTSLWPVGRALCDVYRLEVEAWAPAPELYDVLIGLYDAETEERLEARDEAGNVVPFPAPAQVRVAPARAPAEPAHVLDYRLGARIELRGYGLSEPVRAGAPLTVTLTWHAVAPPEGDYTVFVHLLDEDGTQLDQHDSPPRYGRYPTSAWQAGDVVRDEHVLEVPASGAGRPLYLALGMYRPGDGTRLEVAGPEGPLPDGRIVIPLDGEGGRDG
jgi:hypothetical protein